MDQKQSLLIVDDDVSVLKSIEAGLLPQGYRCETATNAEAALEVVRETSFDIMITDIVLNGMDGFELTGKARKLRPAMLVIIMTGFIEDFSYDRAIEAGASDFIKKPFTLQELIIRIQLVNLQDKLLKMAVTDDLTGLCNRRGFFNLAEQQLKLARRETKGLVMLYADLDNLKTINDTFGHQSGDQALIDVATILKATFRDSDIVARIGGDEFTVLPIGTSGDNIEKITGRLQKNLENHNETKGQRYTLSISFGIACYDPANPCSIDELLAQGDKMMYQQKKLKKQA